MHVFDAKKETVAHARLRVCWPAAQIIGARSSQLPSILAALASNLPHTGWSRGMQGGRRADGAAVGCSGRAMLRSMWRASVCWGGHLQELGCGTGFLDPHVRAPSAEHGMRNNTHSAVLCLSASVIFVRMHPTRRSFVAYRRGHWCCRCFRSPASPRPRAFHTPYSPAEAATPRTFRRLGRWRRSYRWPPRVPIIRNLSGVRR